MLISASIAANLGSWRFDSNSNCPCRFDSYLNHLCGLDSKLRTQIENFSVG